MNFNLTKPCKDCPFLKTATKGWLGKERAEGIAQTITSGKGTFSCHKTTGVTEGITIAEEKQSHCYGALVMLKNMDLMRKSFILYAAEILLDADLSKVEKSDNVFSNDKSFIQHHEY